MSDEYNNDSLLELYLYESTSLLESLDGVLLDAEKGSDLSKDNINEIFRIMHTIKGSSAMMAFNGIADVAHTAEDLFSIIRESGLPDGYMDDLVDIALAVSDFLKAEVDKVQQGAELETGVEPLTQKVAALAGKIREEVGEPEVVDLGRILGGIDAPPREPVRQPEPAYTKVPEPVIIDVAPEDLMPVAPEGGRILGLEPDGRQGARPAAPAEPAGEPAAGEEAGPAGEPAAPEEAAPPAPPESPAAPEGARTPGDGARDLPQADLSRVTESVRNAAGSGLAEPGTYFLHVHFNEGSKMENIRAFMLVNKLAEKGTVGRTIPANVESDPDAAAVIAENGFYLSYTTTLFREQIEKLAKGTLSVESVSFVRRLPEDPNARQEAAAEPPKPAPRPAPRVGADGNPPVPVGADGNPPAHVGADGNPPVPVGADGNPPAHVGADGNPPAQAPAPPPAPVGADGNPPATAPAPPAPPVGGDGNPPAPTVVQHPAPAQSIISVDLKKLDALLDLVGEIVINESIVTENPDIKGMELPNFLKASRRLDKLTSELQDTVMAIRMLPVSIVFQRMRRIVRDMGRDLGKEAELVLIGEATEVDKTILDAIADPLMHLVRNAMDHAIGTAAERVAAGKSPTGHIILSAQNSGGDVIISVTDDGRGLDKGAILAKARERGLLRKPEETYSDREAYGLLMTPGFSLKDRVTEYSGRGVGLDVVKTGIERIGGAVIVESKPGQGTHIMLKIPLTLAIIECMEVRVGESVFSIPITGIRESFKADAGELIRDPSGGEMIMLRGELYPILRLAELYGEPGAKEDIHSGMLVLVDAGDKPICLFVDELVGKFQVVVKPLPKYLARFRKGRTGISGCTIMGNGCISLILNVQELAG
ncbi:MAG: chemotaxis protein CheA [Clostridiales Family XIII bacterium]|jgi:two-component system chemotaxis sensor kinase CheA|nr:chemotaxis protein CheA [Clostridiales Family XIII bacterium]